MQSNRTREQQLDIIDKRVETANAGPEFDERADLDRPAGQQDRPVPPVSPGDERRMPRGVQPDKGGKP